MKTLIALLSSLLFVGSVSADINSDPWQLNVYTVKDIGKSTGYYGSDFQGSAGAGGNVYFSGFSLNLNNSPTNGPFSLYTGGNVNFNSGAVEHGGIEAGGNINLNSITVNGNVSGGANLQGGTGTINGNAVLGGVKNNSPGLVINGSLTQNHSYTPVMNQATVTNYFQSASSFWGDLTPTATTSTQFGLIQTQGLTSGRNIVDLSLATINNSYGVALNAPSDAFVIFNISDTTSPGNDFMKALSFQLSGGIALDDILFNITTASTLSLQGGTYASLLAPGSDVSFSSGVLQGNLIAQNLFGSGQVNTGSFTGFSKDQQHFVKVPEPKSWLILSTLILLGTYLSAKRRQTVQPSV